MGRPLGRYLGEYNWDTKKWEGAMSGEDYIAMHKQKQDRELNTAAGFLSERQDFLHVYTAPSVSGSGYDVVLRIDGTYTSKRDADDAALGMREWMERLTDVDKDDRIWWNGAPWRVEVPR